MHKNKRGMILLPCSLHLCAGLRSFLRDRVLPTIYFSLLFSWNLLVSKTLPDFQENPPTRWQGVIHSGKEDSGFSQTFLSAIYLLVLVSSFFALLELLVITWIDSNELHRPEGISYQSEVQLSVQSVQKHKLDQLSFDHCVYEHWFSWVSFLIFICAIKMKIKSVSSDVQRTVTWEPVSLALMGDAGTAWEENVQLLTS